MTFEGGLKPISTALISHYHRRQLYGLHRPRALSPSNIWARCSCSGTRK